MIQRLLVELDALLDTRLGTMACIDPAAAADLLVNGYDTRMSDEFEKFTTRVTAATFKEAYQNREIHSLMFAIPTEMNASMLDIIMQLEHAKLGGSPEVESIHLEVNYWPYKLEPWEVEQFAAIINTQIGTMTNLKMVNVSPSELTLEYLLYKAYTAIIIYNFQDWLDAQFGSLTEPPKTLLPGISLIVPQLSSHGEAKLREGFEIRNSKGQNSNPFEIVRYALASIIGVTYFSSRHFSAMKLVTPERRGHT
jgi:hypothetical protein